MDLKSELARLDDEDAIVSAIVAHVLEGLSEENVLSYFKSSPKKKEVEVCFGAATDPYEIRVSTGANIHKYIDVCKNWELKGERTGKPHPVIQAQVNKLELAGVSVVFSVKKERFEHFDLDDHIGPPNVDYLATCRVHLRRQ